MKLLDQLVFDTTKVIGLLILTIIAGAVGLLMYGFLSWVFKVKELEIYAIFIRRVISWPMKLATPDPTAIDAQEKNPS